MRAASRVVAVGTAAVRTIETAARQGGVAESQGDTELFIYLPKNSPLMPIL